MPGEVPLWSIPRRANMTGAVEALVRFLAEFSARRALGLVVLGLLVALGFVGYELLTSRMRLERIERIAELNERLSRLDTTRLNADSSLREVHRRMKEELRDAARRSPPDLRRVAGNVPSLGTAFKRFVAGAMIWVFISFGVVPTDDRMARDRRRRSLRRLPPLSDAELRERNRNLNRSSALAAVLALLFGTISVFLPLKEAWWFLFLVYPLIVFVIGFGFFGLFELLFNRPADSPSSVPPTPQ